jgi:hypothetical protein
VWLDLATIWLKLTRKVDSPSTYPNHRNTEDRDLENQMTPLDESRAPSRAILESGEQGERNVMIGVLLWLCFAVGGLCISGAIGGTLGGLVGVGIFAVFVMLAAFSGLILMAL